MLKRLPLLTLALAAAARAVHAVPGAADLLQYDRDALLRGEWWRVLSGHLAHFSTNHLAWDVGVLLVLGGMCEAESRGRTLAALLVSSLGITAALWWWQPGLTIYRGLSGLDSALFGLLAGRLLHRPQKIARFTGALALLVVLAKSGCELRTDATVFASGEGYAPVPLAHVLGVVGGLLSAGRVPRWLVSRATSRTAPSPCR